MRRPSAYRIFLTRSSEYHVRSNHCFGVRDRRSGGWIDDHPALRGRLTGAYAEGGGITNSSQRLPLIGECLVFGEAGQLRTSPVLSVEEREAVQLGGKQGVESMRCVPPPPRSRDTHEAKP